jgi:Trk K+ transport system NAD-binding subunit
MAAVTYADWRGHVIVCGLRGLGLRIVEQLSLSGVPAVVVDDDPDVRMARILRDWDVPRIAASSRVAETLTGAGLAGALAVVCVLGDDLSTLETALLSQQLRPDVRVVVELENPAVGRALTQVGVAVLDVAGLSAPSVVEACLGGNSQELSLSGEPYIAIRTTAAQAGTLRELYAALPPIAVIPAAGGEVVICPGRDEPVAAGDEVTLIGTPEELRAIGLSGRPAGAKPPAAARAVRRVRGVRALAMSLVHAGDRRLALAMAALLVVVVASTATLHLVYRLGIGHMPVLDSLYFTVETVTTVGYGDFSFRGQDPWLMGGAICLMIAGAVFVAVFFALLTNVVVGRRIEESLGHERITGLNGHILVIGLGSIGLRVVQQLMAAGRDIVVVERDEHNRHLGQARDLGIPVVIADATLPSVLESVRLASASAVAIMTSDDLANLETGLAVRDQLGERWETTPVVLRIFDQRFARSVKHTFGFTTVRSTAALAAPWFVGAALGLEVLSTFYAGDELLLVARLNVSPDGGLKGLAMSDLGARTRVLAIRRAADPLVLDHLPRRTTRFRPSDQAFLIGPYSDLLTVLRRDRPAPREAAVTESRTANGAGAAAQPPR